MFYLSSCISNGAPYYFTSPDNNPIVGITHHNKGSYFAITDEACEKNWKEIKKANLTLKTT